MGTTITFSRPDGQQASGYLAKASRAGAPGLVVIQEWWGLQDQIKGMCDRFAAAGYDALAPDLYKGDVVPYHDADAANREMSSLNFVEAAEQDGARRRAASAQGRRQGRAHRLLHGRRSDGDRRLPDSRIERGGVRSTAFRRKRWNKPADVKDSAAGAFLQHGRLFHAEEPWTRSRRDCARPARLMSSTAMTPIMPS